MTDKAKPRRELMRCPCCTHWVLTKPNPAERAERVRVFVFLTSHPADAVYPLTALEEVTGVDHAQA